MKFQNASSLPFIEEPLNIVESFVLYDCKKEIFITVSAGEDRRVYLESRKTAEAAATANLYLAQSLCPHLLWLAINKTADISINVQAANKS